MHSALEGSRKVWTVVIAALLAAVVAMALAMAQPQDAYAKTVTGNDSYACSFGTRLPGKVKITKLTVKGSKVTVKGRILKMANKKAYQMGKGTYTFKLGKNVSAQAVSKKCVTKYDKATAMKLIKKGKFEILNFTLQKGKVAYITFSG